MNGLWTTQSTAITDPPMPQVIVNSFLSGTGHPVVSSTTEDEKEEEQQPEDLVPKSGKVAEH